jgi:hypothetical protein
MPGRNRTGSMGQGPRTGSGMGRIGGTGVQGEASPRGRGWGMGRGWGWRNRGGAGKCCTSDDPGRELTDLRQQLEQLEQHLRELTARVQASRVPPVAPEGERR